MSKTREAKIESTELPLDALKWDLNTPSATEGQTFYLTTDQGDFCFVQVLDTTHDRWSIQP